MWRALAISTSLVIAAAYAAISFLILVPLWRARALRSNRLGLATGLIFFSCSGGHLIHAEHFLLSAESGSWPFVDWHAVVWDVTTAAIAVWYWSMRPMFGAIVSPGSLFVADTDLRYRLLVDHLSDTLVTIVGEDLRIETVAGPGVSRLEAALGPLPGRHLDELGDAVPVAVHAVTERALLGEEVTPTTFGVGEGRWLEIGATPLSLGDGRKRVQLVLRDVTGRLQAEQAAADARAQFELAFESAPIGMALCGPASVVVEVNAALVSFLDLSADQLVGRSLDEVVPGAALPRPRSRNDEREATEWRVTVDDGERWAVVTATDLREADGEPLVLYQVEDVTDRKRAEEHLSHLALHDPLTGLANRTLFAHQLAQALATAERTGRGVAVLFLDLDGFKVINDSLGHAAGDRLLCEVSQRLQAAVRPSDLVARMGGDEFTILCADIGCEHEAITVAERVRTVVEADLELDGSRLSIGASVGIAVCERAPWPTAERILRDADTALYRAKSRGRHRWELFDEQLRQVAVDRFAIERELRVALDEDQLCIAFQPQYAAAGGKVLGFEALVRWDHPTRGRLLPAAFIDVALETGLIIEMGRAVLRKACAEAAPWLAADPALGLSVNLSERELGGPGLLEDVVRSLTGNQIRPDQLCVEVTEQTLFDVHGSAAEELRRIGNLGVRLSVDDFGTGYSSLSHLADFRVDEIKIDRRFIAGTHGGDRNQAIVEGVVALAHALGARTVAEGAETREDLVRLRRAGCDRVQGFLLGHPIPGAEVTTLLAEGALTSPR